MITLEQIEKVIAGRLGDHKTLQFEMKNGLRVKGVHELVEHIKNPNLMNDAMFYHYLMNNFFVKWVRDAAKDEGKAKKINVISEDVDKKTGLTGRMSESELRNLLKNVQRKKVLDSARKKIAKIFDIKSEKWNKEMKRINKVINAAYKLAMKGDEIEQRMIMHLRWKLNVLKRAKEQENKLLELLKIENKDSKVQRAIEKALEKHLAHMKELGRTDEVIKIREDEIFKIKADVEKMLEREFGEEAKKAPPKKVSLGEWRKQVEERRKLTRV